MARIRNRMLSWLIALSMLLTLLPAKTHAVHGDTPALGLHKDQPSSGYWINPMYAGLDMDADLLSKDQTLLPLTIDISIDDVHFTLDEAADALRTGMVKRQEEISVSFPANADFDATAIWENALAHTGDPKQGDYLLGQLHYYSWDAYYSTISGAGYYTYIFSPGYFTTATQEQEVDTAVAALLKELDLADASDYSKVKGIYDWLCANVSYDHDHANDSSYLLKHSAYAALINKTAVCQGYAVLFYRLALELGVDARYITGSGNGGAHAWNIVKLDGLYYNLDATWDRSRYEAQLDYAHFLRSSANFSDHQRDDVYDTPEFHQSYPMSPEDYGSETAWPVTGTCGESLSWSLDENGQLTVSGTGDMYDFYSSDPGWHDYIWHIQKVVIGENVKTVGAFAFHHSFNLTEVSILGSAILAEGAFSYCTALEQVDMPKVTVLSDNVFYSCSALTAVNLPASLLQIGSQVFYDCVSLQELTVDPKNAYYCARDNVLFNKDMTHLYFAASHISATYAIPETVVLISDYAFYGNQQLRYVTVPESVTVLPEGAFYLCSALESVSLPSGLTAIGDFAFFGCTSVLQITLPKKLQQIGYNAFGCCTGISGLTIPASVAVIADCAFMDCSALVVVTFLGPAPQIGDDAFGNVFAEVFYPNPACNSGWTADLLLDYGGFLSWIATDAHSYSAVVTAPTCEEEGYTTYTCGCGDTYTEDYVDALGHAWDDGVITVIPTEEQSGSCTYTCTTCGATNVVTLPPETHEHSYTETVTPPTCTEDGYTTFTCRCGHSYKDRVVSKTGHSMSDWARGKAPTCTAEGEERRDCANCDHYEIRKLDPLGHSFTNYLSDQNATCTRDGTKTARCDNGCGSTDTVADPGSATGHSHKAVVTAPTCTEQGFTTHTCHCGDTYVDAYVSATGHKMGSWQIVKPATREEEGLRRRTCENCDHTEEEIIPVVTGPTEVTSDRYTIQNGTIARIASGITVSEFLKGINEAEYVKLYKDGAQVSDSTKVGTGMELRLIVNEEVIQSLTIIVTGDVNGDGAISLTDMLLLKSHVLKKSTLVGAFALAADTSGDGAISITDFIQIKAQILGKSNITPHTIARKPLITRSNCTVPQQNHFLSL